MRPVFADTFFFIAFYNRRDRHNALATDYMRHLDRPFITSAWILLELADAFSSGAHRTEIAEFVGDIRRNPSFSVVPPSQRGFDAGLSLYAARPDKDWSLTDCLSFCIMKELEIQDALTGDHHFTQAGFNILFP